MISRLRGLSWSYLSEVQIGSFVGLALFMKPLKVVVTNTVVPLYYSEATKGRIERWHPKGRWKWEKRGAEGRDCMEEWKQ